MPKKDKTAASGSGSRQTQGHGASVVPTAGRYEAEPLSELPREHHGPGIVPHYMERHMTFYPVTPREMRDLSFFNTASVVFGSGGSFLLSTAIASAIGGAFAE